MMSHLRLSEDPQSAHSPVSAIRVALSERSESALIDWIQVKSHLSVLRLAGSCRVNNRRSNKNNLLVISGQLSSIALHLASPFRLDSYCS